MRTDNNYSICIKMFLLSIFIMFGGHLYADGIRIVDPTKPLQAQFSEPNTIYVINKTCDLKGQTIIFPEGTVLKFEGGKLTNGAILKSRFLVEATRIQVFDNICFGTINDDNLKQVNPVHVRVLSNDAFLNIETDQIAKKGDIVNFRSLYSLSNPSRTIPNSDGTRKVKIDEKEYFVSDIQGNYTYPTRNIVGIDLKTGEMLKSAVIGKENEIFYKVTPVKKQNTSTLLNREVFPEWFGCKADAIEDQGYPLNYCVDVASNSRSIVLLTSGKFRITKPVIATTNTKIIGIDSSPWNVCTNLSVETTNGIIVFDEKGCNNVLLEGLSFSAHSKKWIENYVGIEVRTSLQGMLLKNISCFQPKIGIYFYAYSDLLSASVDNYKQLSGEYGIVMQPLFKTTFKSSYCNGNRVDIGSGGSALMKKNAVYVKNCEGNSISYNAGEQYGNPSVYCDNSTITLSGIAWHEESVFLQAVNHSRVTIIGELYAMGAFLVDHTSTVSYDGIKDSKYRHNIINPNYHCIAPYCTYVLKFDDNHASFLDKNGNVITECAPQDVKYINGNPYCRNKSGFSFQIPYEKKKGMTIFMRVASSGEPHVDSYIKLDDSCIFQFASSVLFPVNNIVSKSNNDIVGYLVQGESVMSFCIQEENVYYDGRIVGELKTNNDSVILRICPSVESFMISDILCVEGVVNEDFTLHAYEHYLINSIKVDIPKSGKIRPKLTRAYQGHLFFDEQLERLIVWSGRIWLNVDGTRISQNE